MTSHEEHPKFLFISDLHLGGFAKQKNDFLENVFSNIVEYAIINQFELIIHGDLLDYYMQYGDRIPAVAQKPFQKLADYNQRSGYSAVFITGNHDNWDVNFIEKIGCVLIHEYYEVEINGEKVFITHGDGLKDPKFNFPRPRLHRLLRNSYFVKMFKFCTSPTIGNTIMHKFSKLNRRLSSNTNSETNKLDSWATTLLKKFDYDVVICGHHHQLRHIKTTDGIYINTGCFYNDLTFARYTNRGFELVNWNSDTNEISPRTTLEK